MKHVEQPSGAKFYNVNASYSINFSERQLTLNLAGNANITESPVINNRIYGPSTSVRKSLMDRKASISAMLSYNNAYQNDELTGRVINVRLSGNWRIKEKHQLSLNAARIYRDIFREEVSNSFSELTVQVGYSYNFGF